jgi:hypothetical protein
MKRTLANVLMVTTILVFFAACKKSSSSSSSNNNSSTPHMTAKVNGTVQSYTATAHLNSGYLIIVGGNASSSSIGFNIGGYAIGNTGDFSFTSATNSATLSNGSTTYYANSFDGGSGKVTITSSTSTAVKGTFSFTAVDGGGGNPQTVTEGDFYVNF